MEYVRVVDAVTRWHKHIHTVKVQKDPAMSHIPCSAEVLSNSCKIHLDVELFAVLFLPAEIKCSTCGGCELNESNSNILLVNWIELSIDYDFLNGWI